MASGHDVQRIFHDYLDVHLTETESDWIFNQVLDLKLPSPNVSTLLEMFCLYHKSQSDKLKGFEDIQRYMSTFGILISFSECSQRVSKLKESQMAGHLICGYAVVPHDQSTQTCAGDWTVPSLKRSEVCPELNTKMEPEKLETTSVCEGPKSTEVYEDEQTALHLRASFEELQQRASFLSEHSDEYDYIVVSVEKKDKISRSVAFRRKSLAGGIGSQ